MWTDGIASWGHVSIMETIMFVMVAVEMNSIMDRNCNVHSSVRSTEWCSLYWGTRYSVQLLIAAWDSGNPNVVITTVVTITMKRNEFAPDFSPDNYEATVSEHDAVGTNVTRVVATDNDLSVSVIWRWCLKLHNQIVFIVKSCYIVLPISILIWTFVLRPLKWDLKRL